MQFDPACGQQGSLYAHDDPLRVWEACASWACPGPTAARSLIACLATGARTGTSRPGPGTGKRLQATKQLPLPPLCPAPDMDVANGKCSQAICQLVSARSQQSDAICPFRQCDVRGKFGLGHRPDGNPSR